MTDFVKLVDSKKYIEAEKTIREQLTQIMKTKLLEMKKMVAATMSEEDEKKSTFHQYKVTHHDGSVTDHTVEVKHWQRMYPEALSHEIKQQLKAQGKSTRFAKIEGINAYEQNKKNGK